MTDHNMDRFKTRVWDKKTKKYLDENEFFIKANGGLSFYQLGGRGEFNIKRYVKEQCSGKKAKDGKLLYEGDLIVCKYYPFYRDKDDEFKELNYIGEVCWHQEDTMWIVHLYPISDRVVGGACGKNLWEYEECEIIGNINDDIMIKKILEFQR